MFFGVSGKYLLIKRANLDGTNVTTLFEGSKYGIPKVLTIDYHNNRLYWVDSRHLKLESISIDGRWVWLKVGVALTIM